MSTWSVVSELGYKPMKGVSQQSAEIGAPAKFDVARVRQDFPILSQKVHGKPLVYFDNSAMNHRPAQLTEGFAHALF